MSGGAWTYNRFDLHEKKADKDYDGDGKVESSKDEYFGSKDKAIKKAMGKKSDKKDDCECKEEVEQVDEGSCGSKGYQKGGEVKKDKKKSEKKEYPKPNPVTGVYEGGQITKDHVLAYIMENDMANNVVSAEVLFEHISDEFLEAIEDNIMEIYKGKHGQSEKEYQDGRSNAGKMISGDSKHSGAAYSSRAVKNSGPNPAGGSKKPQGQGRMSSNDRAYLKMMKANNKK